MIFGVRADLWDVTGPVAAPRKHVWIGARWPCRHADAKCDHDVEIGGARAGLGPAGGGPAR